MTSALLATNSVRTAQPFYYPDDPIRLDDDMRIDASHVAAVEDSGGYDFAVNTITTPGERADVPALNVNTVGEVPDSSWFVNGSTAAPLREPGSAVDAELKPLPAAWRISGGKSAGVQPGFRMTDAEGHLHQIEFDPPSNPEMASGAEIIGTGFYRAFGYHTVDVHLATLDPDAVMFAPDARIWDTGTGRYRAMERRDLRHVLRRAARRPDGTYRVLVSRFADGKPLGNFRYYGTRPDDPNDIVPHEHRRELRGARVFAAWLNHDDSRGVNSLDMLERSSAGAHVKHYMFDFGSILGSGTVRPQSDRAGHEYLFEWRPGLKALATLGLTSRPWAHVNYEGLPPAVGHIEADAFDPVLWRPEYPNSAFLNMQPDDAFWAARIVARFSEAEIRKVVEQARYSDSRATDHVTRILVERRQKVLAAWLTAVNPVADLHLGRDGVLTWSNAAEEAGASESGSQYAVQWARFDNATGTSTDIGLTSIVDTTKDSAPAALVRQLDLAFIEARVTTTHSDHPHWRTPVIARFRRTGADWTLVGLSRTAVPTAEMSSMLPTTATGGQP